MIELWYENCLLNWSWCQENGCIWYVMLVSIFIIEDAGTGKLHTREADFCTEWMTKLIKKVVILTPAILGKNQHDFGGQSHSLQIEQRALKETRNLWITVIKLLHYPYVWKGFREFMQWRLLRKWRCWAVRGNVFNGLIVIVKNQDKE